MTHNFKVVKYFITAFHENKIDDVSYIISPLFSFTLNAGETQSFEACAKRVKFLNERTHFRICEPMSKDDKYFYAECEIKIPNEIGEMEDAFGKAEFIVENGLMLALNARYYKSREEYDEFSKLLDGSQIAFV